MPISKGKLPTAQDRFSSARHVEKMRSMQVKTCKHNGQVTNISKTHHLRSIASACRLNMTALRRFTPFHVHSAIHQCTCLSSRQPGVHLLRLRSQEGYCEGYFEVVDNPVSSSRLIKYVKTVAKCCQMLSHITGSSGMMHRL